VLPNSASVEVGTSKNELESKVCFPILEYAVIADLGFVFPSLKFACEGGWANCTCNYAGATLGKADAASRK
jgi:hypothetical protein